MLYCELQVTSPFSQRKLLFTLTLVYKSTNLTGIEGVFQLAIRDNRARLPITPNLHQIGESSCVTREHSAFPVVCLREPGPVGLHNLRLAKYLVKWTRRPRTPPSNSHMI